MRPGFTARRVPLEVPAAPPLAQLLLALLLLGGWEGCAYCRVRKVATGRGRMLPATGPALLS